MGFCKLSGTGMMNKYSWTENISAHAFRLENVQIKLVSSSEPILGFNFFAERLQKKKCVCSYVGFDDNLSFLRCLRCLIKKKQPTERFLKWLNLVGSHSEGIFFSSVQKKRFIFTFYIFHGRRKNYFCKNIMNLARRVKVILHQTVREKTVFRRKDCFLIQKLLKIKKKLCLPRREKTTFSGCYLK